MGILEWYWNPTIPCADTPRHIKTLPKLWDLWKPYKSDSIPICQHETLPTLADTTRHIKTLPKPYKSDSIPICQHETLPTLEDTTRHIKTLPTLADTTRHIKTLTKHHRYSLQYSSYQKKLFLLYSYTNNCGKQKFVCVLSSLQFMSLDEIQN